MSLIQGAKARLQTLPQTIHHRGYRGGLKHWAGTTYLRATRSLNGENVYSREWDVLVILDACRTDLLREISTEYRFLSSIDKFSSQGSCTAGWMEGNFSEEKRDEIEKTTYVAGNPFARSKLTDKPFVNLDHVWRYGWDSNFGGVPPRPVTDRAIDIARSNNPDRLIIHYLQPHIPFVSEDSEALQLENFGGDHYNATPGDWVLVQRGKRAPNAVWSDYQETLRWVLNDVSLLVENIDASKMVISADHGNAFGEWGIYGHPGRTPLPCLTEVPWTEVSTTDSETYEPNQYGKIKQGFDLEARLKELGYV